MRQHDFAIVLEILEGCDRIPQLLYNSFPHVALHALPHDQETHRSKSCCDQNHREQKAGPQAGASHQRFSGIHWKSLRGVF